ncbi:hypothetical protein [Cellulomonas sp. PhB150]|uniref:hypothetical protein n=1 Tax=Cellulomonas sp. PhB150 TaxID=2485188 RepID=UPI000F46134C|nr:hypothetical protein [Cellulomonas sp. PhB150]ROS26013.1 hypothetical protein EDF34_2339 [Cellulomonas sp. PhB150]
MRHLKTRVLASLGAFALALATTAGFSVPAWADSSELVACTGSVTVQYSPALGALPRQTTQQVTETLGSAGGGSCSGPFTSGLASTTFQQQVSCLLQGLGDTLVQNVVTYVWGGGQYSTITYPVTTVAHAAGQETVTSIGTVTAGYGLGAASVRVAVYVDLDLVSCLTSSVTQQTGTLAVTIL